MERFRKYKIAIIILSVLLIVESALLIFLWLHKPKKVAPETARPITVKGKIAIVIDDWGYNLNNIGLLEQIKQPLTLSILPNLPFSRRIAQEAKNMGFEVILHLPMEPAERYRMEKNTITATMREQEILNILRHDLSGIAVARGVSNHMGSRATRDSRVMAIVFGELKKQGLFFLDSFVSGSSVSSELAQKMHVAFARRDVFLDNEKDPEYILSQISKLKLLARRHGQAIGIAHDRAASMRVLKDALPSLAKEGYQLVFVSDLLH